ncbi:MAG TPA: DUF4296 domain-containing protein [Taishania sp.]|nr:DUF4296 domain-containing protein [Taishania sp.]
MMRWSYIFLLTLGLFACKPTVEVGAEKPATLLTKEQMVAILTDLTIMESVYQQKYIQVPRFSYLMIKEADSIFKKHGTSQLVFDANMDYYSADLEALESIYQQVKSNLIAQQNALPKVETLPQDDSSKVNKKALNGLPFHTEESMQHQEANKNK